MKQFRNEMIETLKTQELNLKIIKYNTSKYWRIKRMKI
jgi:hypothetical protein